jgi:4'-phosphopantetheinyl transferase
VWWLAREADTLPSGLSWLTPREAERVAQLRYAKRRSDFLLRRVTAKHALAAVLGLPADPSGLARVEVGNAPSGAPYALVDGAPAGLQVSISDRAGRAVCVVGVGAFGCDLELVEPRSDRFARDFLTEAEREFLAARPHGDPRDAAANLVWSAKESALKALRTGLRRDTRSVEVAIEGTVETARRGRWEPLTVRAVEGPVLPGWWRRDGDYVFTVASEVSGPPPVALVAAADSSGAMPRCNASTR